MQNSQSHLALVTAVNATRYLPATLQKYPSGWLIDYYVENPQTQYSIVEIFYASCLIYLLKYFSNEIRLHFWLEE